MTGALCLQNQTAESGHLGETFLESTQNPGCDLTSPEGRWQNHSGPPTGSETHTPRLVRGDAAQVIVATWRRWEKNENEKHVRARFPEETYWSQPLNGGTISGPPSTRLQSNLSNPPFILLRLATGRNEQHWSAFNI